MVVQILLNLLKLSDEKLNRYLAPVSHGGSFCFRLQGQTLTGTCR